MDLSHAALLVVDLQNDFCPPDGALAIPGGRDLAAPINKLLSLNWRLRIATQDWHPADHVSFASTHAAHGKSAGDLVELTNPHNAAETARVKLFPDHCVQGTRGAELIAELDAATLDHVVRKGQDRRVEQFSGFRDTTFSNPCVAKSELLDLLLAADVDAVYVVGLAGDVCAKATAEHAVDHGFLTTVLSDGVRIVNETDASLKIYADQLRARGVRYHSSTAAGILPA